LDLDQARYLLDRIGALRHPCDLDLLLFFARHPRTLLTSEQLAALIGYGLQQTAESLDLLLNAELLTRTQNPTGAARMYVLAAGPNAEWLPSLLEFASTRSGRLAMRRVLARPRGKRTAGLAAPAERDATAAHATRPSLVRRRTDVVQHASADRPGRKKR